MTVTTADRIGGQARFFQVDPGEKNSDPVEAMKFSLVKGGRPRVTVLMADDDFDDCLLAQEAWEELHTEHLLKFVHDGQELLDYIYHEDPQAHPSPALILLDLNMPKKNGREVLKALKADPRWQHIPIIVFTTSKNIDHIIETYQDGANAFMSKPSTYEGYVQALQSIELFWLTLAEIPNR